MGALWARSSSIQESVTRALLAAQVLVGGRAGGALPGVQGIERMNEIWGVWDEGVEWELAAGQLGRQGMRTQGL